MNISPIRRAYLDISLTPEGLRRAADDLEAANLPDRAEVVDVEQTLDEARYFTGAIAVAARIQVTYEYEEEAA